MPSYAGKMGPGFGQQCQDEQSNACDQQDEYSHFERGEYSFYHGRFSIIFDLSLPAVGMQTNRISTSHDFACFTWLFGGKTISFLRI